MNEKYNFVIARRWEEEPDRLCVYAYHTEVHYGDDEYAQALLKHINYKSPNQIYKIYKINLLDNVKN
jgi:hypothetical protein